MQHRIAALLYALALSACEPIADDPATPSPQPQAPDVTGSKQPAPEGGPATMPAPPVVSIKRLDGTGNLRAVTDEVKVIPPDSQEIADPGSVDSLEYKIKCNAWSAGNTYKIDFTVTDSFNHPDGPAGSDKETLTVTCEDCSKGTAAQPKCSDTTNFCKTLSDSSTPPNTTHYCDACPANCGGNCNGTTSCTLCNIGYYNKGTQTDCSTPCPGTNGKHCEDVAHTACHLTSGATESCTACAPGYHNTSSKTDCSTACVNSASTHCANVANATCDRDSSGNQTTNGTIINCNGFCLNGFYGETCGSNCANNTNTSEGPQCQNVRNATCDRNSEGTLTTDGTIINCNGRCNAGFYGTTCSSKCANGSTSGPHCADTTIATCDSPTSGTITNCNGSCIDGWYGTDCAQSCRTHNSGSIGNCTATATVTCAQNGGGNPVCSECKTGYYNNTHTNCTDACPNNDGSKHCSNPAHTVCNISGGSTISCTACDSHYYNTAGTSTCTQACSNLIQTDINHCANASNATCSDNGSNLNCNSCESNIYTGDACDQCASSYYKKYTSYSVSTTPRAFNCVNNCGDGYYANSSTQECLKCTSPCTKCVDNASKCTACGSNYLLTNNSCQACSSTNCASCDGSNQCVGCKDGYYGNTCATQCVTNCKTCASDSTCSECKSNYTLSEDKKTCTPND